MRNNSAEDLSDMRQYVSFFLGEELFGVEVNRAREILNMAPLTQVPQTPDFMLGVINLRGQVVPVIDMRIKLNIPISEQTENTCIIVVEIHVDGGLIVVGLLADAVSEVLDITDDQIEAPPRLGTKIDTAYIQGMGKVDDRFLILLDIDKVFSAADVSLASEPGE